MFPAEKKVKIGKMKVEKTTQLLVILIVRKIIISNFCFHFDNIETVKQVDFLHKKDNYVLIAVHYFPVEIGNSEE